MVLSACIGCTKPSVSRPLKDLERAARKHKIRELRGFTAKTEEKILAEIELSQEREQRFKIATAEDFAQTLCAYLQANPRIGRVVVAGSYRRRKETVGDLDILVTCAQGQAAVDHFIAYDEVAKVVAKGSTRATVMLKSGIQVDLRVVPAEELRRSAALFHRLEVAQHRHSQAGTGTRTQDQRIWHLPRWRTDRRADGGGSLLSRRAALISSPSSARTAAKFRRPLPAELPRLISLEDIRGDLHVHTKASDGKSSLREMVEAARARGYQYVAITDHTKHATVARGLDEKRLAKQLDEIEKLSEDFDDIRILKSSEVDILADGKLDLSDSMLKRLDLVVAAVHYKFELNARGANRAHAAGHGQQISEHPCSPDRAFTR